MRVILRVLLFLIFLEIFFRVGGAFTAFIRDLHNNTSLSHSEYRILCLGESMTYDGGDDAYPNQLQKLFDQNFPSLHVKIINASIPGGGSDVILGQAIRSIAAYKPQMVVAMMGLSDYGNWTTKTGDAGIHLRVWRLARTIVKNVREFWRKPAPHKPAVQTASSGAVETEVELALDKIWAGPVAYRQMYFNALILHANKRYAESENLFLLLIQNTHDSLLLNWMYRKLADVYKDAGQYYQFAMVMKHFLDDNPEDPWVTQWTWEMCKKKTGDLEIRSMLSYMIQNNPKTESFYNLMCGCMTAEGDLQGAAQMMQQAKAIREKSVNTMTKKNYAQLLKMLHNANIVPVFVQYPRRDLKLLKDLFVGEDTAGVVFVDNKSDFDAAVEHGGYERVFKDSVGGDFGHCTKMGYSLLAKNVFNQITKQMGLSVRHAF